MIIKFSEIYKNIIPEDIPRIMIDSGEDRGGYLGNNKGDSKKYKREYKHAEDGFVKLYCEDYEN